EIIPKYRNTIQQTASAKSGQVSLVKNMLIDTDDLKKSRVDYVEVPVEDITPRSINKYTQGRIDRLAKSIRNTGNRLIHPIVLVRGEDLNPESDVYKKFVEKGIEPKALKYIIVSGERRYRAWLKLREEEAALQKGSINKFDTITANILSQREVSKEHYFYEDSNLESRQLTSLEAVLHIKSIIDDVQTIEEQRNALIEMGKDPEKKKFNQSEYCKYYLENELGIENVSLGTIKNDLAILNNCDDKVIEAVLDGRMYPSDARKIYPLDKTTQRELLAIYLDSGIEKFDARVDVIKGNKKEKKVGRKEAAGYIKAYIANSRKSLKMMEDALSELGESDRQVIMEAIELIDRTSRTAEGHYEALKSKYKKKQELR
ncbi:MAG: hypothetical protein Q4A15_07675, partial [Prevotellaceae bacterium]|nr:hypothetical protein [Prevotellaceae bacterium]